MPRLEETGVNLGPAELRPFGLKYCRGDECTYRYAIDLRGKRLSMEIGIRRDLVEKGFFPIYVPDTHSAKGTMGWQGEGVEVSGRSGMYFEVSGLPKGEHPWDFWIRLGTTADLDKPCPEPVNFRQIL